MVISNWVERKLEERRINREQMLIEQGRKEGFEQGRAYERERIQAETNGQASDDPYRENGR
jgi:hypothetical protein